jgi:hypothetical protein
MTSSALSNFMRSLPKDMALVSDNAKSASQPATHAATKPAKASRWGETKAQGKLDDLNRLRSSAPVRTVDVHDAKAKGGTGWESVLEGKCPL